MTKEELALRLSGREYGNEITKEEAAYAKSVGLVVVFGASDDLIEFRGAIDDEGSVINGGKALIMDGQLYQNPDCDCVWAQQAVEDAKNFGMTIEAIWCDPEADASWTYKTDIPHETFDVMEDGEVYCRGLVFAIKDATK